VTNYARVLEDANNAFKHSDSVHNLKEALRKLADAYVELWDENERDQLSDTLDQEWLES
jgi:hypothetical protein